jgi:serine/threonine-protein kinase
MMKLGDNRPRLIYPTTERLTMVKVAPDRNLLFGLLALQVGLIDQGQLVAALQAWTREKGRPLADHLVGRGDLDVDQRAGVEGMVALHLKKHGGDAERSLAAIPSAASLRARLTQVGPAEDAECTVSYSVGALTSAGQRFQILRPHATGGLGAVFVALDGELHREVALMQILDHHADDPFSRQRFLLEAEITGGLEHPGVVPVYGLGAYPDGRPYYAMRFVRGESLKEAIGRFHAHAQGSRDLAFRKLLRRFLDVCNAIDYAHSRGILHRDIKPANVILGKHGETLVVDWGLAKAIGRSGPTSGERTLVPRSASGSAETLPGSAMGTPAYMSPEQAEGDLAHLGPCSDVYSLGATLYYLLTGKAPLEGDVADVLRAVQKGEFSPPRSVDSTIDRALEAVCLKAMAMKPDDRYPTAKALAEDIERWMADEPVTAWREPLSRRAHRWGRRNRTAVTAAAVAVLVALVGTATVLAVQTQANRDLHSANLQTLHERDLARQNFDLARKAVDDYLTRVGQNPLLKEQGLHELRQELLEAALGYYRDFLRQHSDDPSLRADAAAAHERVGDIQIELGRPGDALAAYDQALALINPLVRERPGDPMLATAQVRLDAGRLQALRDLGSYREAIAAFERASGLGDALLAAGGGTNELSEILARMYLGAEWAFRKTGRTDEALRAARRAHALAEQAARDRPGDPSAARTLLQVSIYAGGSLIWKGQLDEARHLFEQGIAFGKLRVREHPRDLEMRIGLAELESNLAGIEKYTGSPLEALKHLLSTTDSLGALARENPLLIRVRDSWAAGLYNLSQVQTDLRRYADAEQSARTMIDVSEALAREVPSSPWYRTELGYGYGALGKAQLKAGSHAEALAMLRKAMAILETSSGVEALINLASYLTLASTVADPAEGPAAADRQRRDADRAVATLRRAIEMGLAGSGVLKTDPDFDSIRSRRDFHDLLMDLAFPAEPFAP